MEEIKMLSGTAGDIQFILLVIMIAMLLHSGPKFLAFAWGGVVKVTQAAIGVLGTICLLILVAKIILAI